MAVMNKMRELTKGILYLLVLAFIGTIIFDWGMSYTGRDTSLTAVGEVDGVEIDAKQFETFLSSQIDQYRRQAGGEVSDNQINFIRNQVWDTMVRDILIRKELEEKQIKAADSEIIYRLFNAPPEALKTNPSFLDEQQQFDMAKYQAAINDPNLAGQWKPIEDYMRDNLPYEKFQQRLIATVRTTEDEVKREYLKQNQNVKVSYLFINPNKFSTDDVSITDDMISDYYKSHKDEFKQEEQRSIEYVIRSTKPTSQDSSATRGEARSLLQRVKSGEDFTELAEIYSGDPGSRTKGGDLGYFARGAMVKPFEEAAFSASIGDIVGPVESQFGLHIIKVEDKRLSDKDDKGERKEEVKARHILLKFEASRRTLNLARDDAEYLAENAGDDSFHSFAEELGDSVRTSGLFIKGSGFIPGIGVNQSISNFTFRGKVGDVGPIENTNQGLIVFKISEKLSERTKPLSEVSSLIENKLATQARMRKAGELAATIHSTIVNEGTSLQIAAQSDSLDFEETEPFNRTGFVKTVGRDTKFIGAAFALENVGDISAPVEGTRGYYIMRLQEKADFEEADYQAKRAQIASQLQRQKSNQAFANWYADAKEKVEIKDYRDRFYN